MWIFGCPHKQNKWTIISMGRIFLIVDFIIGITVWDWCSGERFDSSTFFKAFVIYRYFFRIWSLTNRVLAAVIFRIQHLNVLLLVLLLLHCQQVLTNKLSDWLHSNALKYQLSNLKFHHHQCRLQKLRLSFGRQN